MSNHIKIYNEVVRELRNTPTIFGVMLNGSLAYGKTSKYSDIDLIVLCDRDEFISRRIDGILVEEHFHTYERMHEGLERNPSNVYKYLYSRVVFDDGRLAEITERAKNIYEKYETPTDVKESIRYWLLSSKDKINGAISSNDLLKASYLVSTNSWEILKGIWAVNDKPTPPSSIAFNMNDSLTLVPFENWFKSLFEDDVLSRANAALRIIDWILQN